MQSAMTEQQKFQQMADRESYEFAERIALKMDSGTSFETAERETRKEYQTRNLFPEKER